jgi:tetratricopeptide (TPR) repeat protein
VENFLVKGFSYCVFYRGQIVAWCTPDCAAGERIDVGIICDPAHRRRGLGAAAVAATVEACFRQGFKGVGWHCNADNIGSWKIAEKVGFERQSSYAYYYYIYDQVNHLAELGWYYYKKGEYGKTIAYYEQVFAQRRDNPHYYYHLVAVTWAALGNKDKALEYLSEAVNHGWANAQSTQSVEEFVILHGDPRWEEILAHMNS